MYDRDPRAEFLETLHQACETFESFDEYTQVVWKAEYLTRSCHHFHYYGICRAGCTSMAGHEINDRDGLNRGADPENMMAVMLGFEANSSIVPYTGPWTKAGQILLNLGSDGDHQAEIVRLSIEKRGQSYCGRKVVVVTDVAYVGFTTPPPATVLSHLSATPDVSPHWCRERHFISGMQLSTHSAEWVASR
jgi:hypothetical protein